MISYKMSQSEHQQ
jgi:hypothetical protein